MIKKGLLIYNPEDYEKNKWFAQELLKQAPAYQLELQLVLRNHLALSISETGTFTVAGRTVPTDTQATEIRTVPNSVHTSVHPVNSTLISDAEFAADASAMGQISSFNDVNFVINRTRDSLIGAHFEKMGCKVFNSSVVTEICNHKGKTHQFINSHSIPSVGTLLCHKDYFNPGLIPFSYPLILKSVSGHGGNEVFKVKDEAELLDDIKLLSGQDFILQKLCSNPGIDIRVFTLGKEIVAAVKRSSSGSFKSNYSLGGSAVSYILRPQEKQLVQKILSLLDFDFVGIDFILDENENLLFNEIEDVVGTRTLYLNYPDIDIVARFLNYIRKRV